LRDQVLHGVGAGSPERTGPAAIAAPINLCSGKPIDPSLVPDFLSPATRWRFENQHFLLYLDTRDVVAARRIR